GATARLPDFRVSLNERQESLLNRIVEAFRASGVFAPSMEELTQAVSAPPDAVEALLRIGLERGQFTRVQEGVYYLAETLESIKADLQAYLREHGTITVAQFRDLTQSNRKFSLLLLEYFDRIGFTRRAGDNRIIVEPPTAE